MAQGLVAYLRQYHHPFLVSLPMGNPHKSRPREAVGLDVRILHILQLKCSHAGRIQDEKEDKVLDVVEMCKELQQLLHPEVGRLLVVGTYIGDLLPVDCLVEHDLQEKLAPCIVGVDAGPLKVAVLAQMQQEGPQVILIQVGKPVLFSCEPAEALQRCVIGLSGPFRTPPKQKVLFHLFQYLFIRHHW